MTKITNQQHQTAFRQIMKGTAIFGGTQIVNLLTNIVRGKLVAMILGAYGMGISSLLNSTITPVIQLFSFGLPTASVSSIANSKDDEEQRCRIIAFRRCLTILAVMACLFMVISSPLLAGLTSGIDTTFYRQGSYLSGWFMALGIAVFFMMLSAGENAVLQSHRALKRLAKCNVVAPMLGLFLGVPMYYFWGISGIVPAMILLAFLTWCYTRWNTYSLENSHNTPRMTWHQTFHYGKDMMTLGGTMMLAGLFGNLVVYIVNTFINKQGGAAEVGFYQAATSITTQCTALVFTALATDYYPHLTQVSSNKSDMQTLVNQECEIVLLVAAVVAALLMPLTPVVVHVLLTREFDSIIPLVQMMSLTFFMRAYYFPLDYICLARNDKKFYFYMEGIWSNVKMLILFIGGYYLFGLIGLGIAVVVNAIIDVIVSTVFVYWRYKVLYSRQVFVISSLLMVIMAAELLQLLLIDNATLSNCLSTVFALGVMSYSFVQLNRRVDFMKIIKERFGNR